MNKKTLIYAVAGIVIVAIVAYLFVPTPLTPECYSRQASLKKQIEKLNHCNTTDDCKAQAMFCPFNCWVFINKNENFTPLKAQVDAYGS